jgi:predicted AlkP superfamily pyrophosphatase or phosphodiesterase
LRALFIVKELGLSEIGVEGMSIVLINAVGLTPRLLALAPRLNSLAQSGWCRPLREAIPAVTCTAQATLLTGQTPEQHGIVGNGWLFRETEEVRFWQQANRLLQAAPIYLTARRRAARRGRPFCCAQLFWWFNQGAAVDISVTPKPHYGADGNKIFDIHGKPLTLIDQLKKNLGPFPFRSFWGPQAGLPATAWIARSAAEVLRLRAPHLTLVYLPHLDYGPQRFGPDQCDMAHLVGQLDAACEPLLEAAKKAGVRVWVVSEYGHVSVHRVVLLNQALRRAGLIAVRPGPFGEQLDLPETRAFAVCDHQLAHVYVRDPTEIPKVRDLLAPLAGVARVLTGEERGNLNLRHPRAGELVVMPEQDAWFPYPFWLDDREAPDYARTVDIHRKPGYDPCELLIDPQLRWPGVRAVWRLAQKWLGFRTLFDVIPLDPTLIRGSHGLPAANPMDGPLLIGEGAVPPGDHPPMTVVHDLLLQALALEE